MVDRATFIKHMDFWQKLQRMEELGLPLPVSAPMPEVGPPSGNVPLPPVAAAPQSMPAPHTGPELEQMPPPPPGPASIPGQVIRGTARGLAHAGAEVLEGAAQVGRPLGNLIRPGAGDRTVQQLAEFQNQAAAPGDGPAEDLANAATRIGAWLYPGAIAARGMNVAGRVGKLFSNRSTIPGRLAEGVVAGAIAENLAFAPTEERLSNAIEGIPGLSNPITAYLQANPEDGMAESVLKQNLEAAGVGALFTTLLPALKQAKKIGARVVSKDKAAPPTYVDPDVPRTRKQEFLVRGRFEPIPDTVSSTGADSRSRFTIGPDGTINLRADGSWDLDSPWIQGNFKSRKQATDVYNEHYIRDMKGGLEEHADRWTEQMFFNAEIRKTKNGFVYGGHSDFPWFLQKAKDGTNDIIAGSSMGMDNYGRFDSYDAVDGAWKAMMKKRIDKPFTALAAKRLVEMDALATNLWKGVRTGRNVDEAIMEYRNAIRAVDPTQEMIDESIERLHIGRIRGAGMEASTPAMVQRAAALLLDKEKAITSVLRSIARDLESDIAHGDISYDDAVRAYKNVQVNADPDNIIPDTVTAAHLERFRKPSKGAVGRRVLEQDEDAWHNWLRRNQEDLREQNRGTIAKWRKSFARGWIDHAGSAKARILEAGGDAGKEAVMRFEIAAGASANAIRVWENLQPEIYEGLSRKMQPAFDRLVATRRQLQIAEYAPKKALRNRSSYAAEAPRDNKGKLLGPKHFLKELENIEAEIGSEAYADMMQRADKYFDAFRGLVDELEVNGIVSPEEAIALKQYDYQPRAWIDAIDPPIQHKFGTTTVSVRSSGLDPLGTGRDAMLQTNSELLLGRAITTVKNRIARNDAARALSRIPDIQGEPQQPGYSRISFMEDGEAKDMWIEEDVAHDWVTRGAVLGSKHARMVELFSGTAMTRFFATGVNMSFAFANLARDLVYIYWTNRGLYGDSFPVFLGQMSRDMGAVAWDAARKKGRYQDYINEGGGMNFLAHGAGAYHKQIGASGNETVWGRTKGRAVEGLDQVSNVLTRVNETMEVNLRLAVRERALRKGMSAQEATYEARRYIDFSQGGSVSKFVDTFIPYLNASIQGMRGSARVFKEDPKRAAVKLGNLAAATTTLWMYNNFQYKDVMDQISPEEKARNWIFPLGGMYTIDEKGDKRYHYLAIPVEHGLMPVKGTLDSIMGSAINGEMPTEQFVEGLKGSTDILGELVGPMPVLAQAIYKYNSNYDNYRDTATWKGVDVPPHMEYSVAPHSPTPTIARDIADAAHNLGIEVSPARLTSAAGSVMPRNTVSGTLNTGYEAARGSPQFDALMDKNTRDILTKAPFTRRFFRTTHPIATTYDGLQEMRQDDNAETKAMTDEVDRMATQGAAGRSEYREYRKTLKREDRNKMDTRMERAADVREAIDVLRGLPSLTINNQAEGNPSWWIHVSSLGAQKRAEAMFQVFNRIGDPTDRKRFRQAILKFPGIRTDEFKRAFNRLLKGH